MKNSIKKHFILAVGAVLLAAAATVFGANVSQEPLTLAVFDFDAKDESVRDLGTKVATLINARLSAEPNLILVERAELAKVLGEQELTMSGTFNPSQAVKVGQLTGAKVLITGRIFKVDKDTVMVAKVISTETSRVYGEIAQAPSASSITDLAADLAKKIANTVNEKGETLVAKVVPRADRIAKLKKSLEGKTLPSVSVKIGEQHFGRPVVDPAAETELNLVLHECGFTVVDDKSKDKADVEITGDAFSAYGMRSEEHTSELQSRFGISYAVFCLKKKKQ